MSDIILEVENLRKYFPVRELGLLQRKRSMLHAVDDVSFSVTKREILGLVGESGSGKTTVLRLLLRLIKPTAGEAKYNGLDIFKMNNAELRMLRRQLAMIFQDPHSSFNPRFTVSDIVGEPFRLQGIAKGVKKERKVKDLLEKVELPLDFIYRYPHELSAGQKQRIGIARGLATNPEFILADEPVSSLDVSVRGQILNLLKKLHKELDLTFIYVSHDLSTVRHFCNRVAVMYVGKLVETAPVEELYNNPFHPYTQTLISAITEPDPKAIQTRIILEGSVPTPIDPPSGCRFHPRCPKSMPQCSKADPELIDMNNGHLVACHLMD